MLAKELDEKEKESFIDAFYMNEETDDLESDYPSGMPWLCDYDIELRGFNVPDMATNYKMSILDDIAMGMLDY